MYKSELPTDDSSSNSSNRTPANLHGPHYNPDFDFINITFNSRGEKEVSTEGKHWTFWTVEGKEDGKLEMVKIERNNTAKNSLSPTVIQNNERSFQANAIIEMPPIKAIEIPQLDENLARWQMYRTVHASSASTSSKCRSLAASGLSLLAPPSSSAEPSFSVERSGASFTPKKLW